MSTHAKTFDVTAIETMTDSDDNTIEKVHLWHVDRVGETKEGVKFSVERNLTKGKNEDAAEDFINRLRTTIVPFQG